MAKAKNTENTVEEPRVYCGPSLPKAKITSKAVFKGGLPKHVIDLIELCPEIGRLTVPVSKFSDTLKRISTKGTEENRLYQVILGSREEIESGV
jgi:hypothetical protein